MEKIPIEDLLLVANKLQGEAQRAQLKLIQFLIQLVFTVGAAQSIGTIKRFEMYAQSSGENYAEPLTQGTGQPPKDQLSKTEALRELRGEAIKQQNACFLTL